MKRDRKLAKILGARELRKRLTAAEKKLWQHLRNRNFFNKKFRRQHILQGFILDFYCPEDKLAIELDGPIHDKQKEYDAERQNVVEDARVKVLRFKNNEVLGNIKKVLQTIKKELNPSPFPMEKGVKE